MPKRKVYKPEAFELEVKKFADAMGIAIEQALVKTGLQMHDDIVAMTPRDTGWAQASWRFTVDNIDPSVPPKGDYPPSAAKKGRMREAVKASMASTINISNNLPYILPLEHGHSQQAPNGMVSVTTLRFRNYMEASSKVAVREQNI